MAEILSMGDNHLPIPSENKVKLLIDKFKATSRFFKIQILSIALIMLVIPFVAGKTLIDTRQRASAPEGLLSGAPVPLYFYEHMAKTPGLVQLDYYTDDIAIYFEDKVDKNLNQWTKDYISTAWEYTKNTYNLGNQKERNLTVLLKTSQGYSRGTIGTYFDGDRKNLISFESSSWSDGGSDKNYNFISHEMGHIVEGTNNDEQGSPTFPVWGDSKWNEILQYDLYLHIGMNDLAKRWYDTLMAPSEGDSYPAPHTHWFPNWYYPIYRDYGGTKVLTDYFRLLAKYYPKNQTGKGYARNLNLGEYVWFMGAAAKTDLHDLATKAFTPWSTDWEAEYQKAKTDFPDMILEAITPTLGPPGYTKCSEENGTCNISGKSVVAFGGNNSYAYKIFNSNVACSSSTFGSDPSQNGVRSCYYKTINEHTVPLIPIPSGPWTKCADEKGTCNLIGTKMVRYGGNSTFSYTLASSSISCSNSVFGDAAPNVVKTCEYADIDMGGSPTPQPTVVTEGCEFLPGQTCDAGTQCASGKTSVNGICGVGKVCCKAGPTPIPPPTCMPKPSCGPGEACPMNIPAQGWCPTPTPVPSTLKCGPTNPKSLCPKGQACTYSNGQYTCTSGYTCHDISGGTCPTGQACVYDGDSLTDICVPAPSPARLAAPANLKVDSVSSTSDPNIKEVHISWSRIAGATKYNIYNVAGTTYKLVATSESSAYAEILNKSTTWYFAVTAVNATSESPKSSTLTLNICQYTNCATPTPSLRPTLSPTPIARDTISPNVVIVSPSNGSNFSRLSTINISASASDNVKVFKVVFHVNGSQKCVDTEAPYSCSWQFPLFPLFGNPSYVITATAYDTSNNLKTTYIQVGTK